MSRLSVPCGVNFVKYDRRTGYVRATIFGPQTGPRDDRTAKKPSKNRGFRWSVWSPLRATKRQDPHPPRCGFFHAQTYRNPPPTLGTTCGALEKGRNLYRFKTIKNAPQDAPQTRPPMRYNLEAKRPNETKTTVNLVTYILKRRVKLGLGVTIPTKVLGQEEPKVEDANARTLGTTKRTQQCGPSHWGGNGQEVQHNTLST